MKQCKSCGYRASDDLTICPVCSTPLDSSYQSSSSIKKIFCSNCGEQIDSSYTICPNCNTTLNQTSTNRQSYNNFQSSLYRECPTCGKVAIGNERYCTNCRTLLPPTPTGVNHYSSQASSTPLILGIIGTVLVGLNFIGIPFVHIIGFILGIIGVIIANNDKKNGNYSSSGYTLSMIALIGGSVSMIIGFILGCMYF